MPPQGDPTGPEVRIRRYAAPDHAAVLALAPELSAGVASWRPAAGVAAAAIRWADDAIAGADRPDRALFVAELAGGVVGFAGVGERSHFSGEREAYLGELVVDRDRRRHGVARALLAAVRAWSAARGLARLTLETGCANSEALAFYRSLGFEAEQVMLSSAVTATGAPEGWPAGP